MERVAFLFHCFQIELESRNVGFCGGRNSPGVPGEKPLEQGREPTTNSTHMTPGPRFKPGPHWREASTLTTASSLLSLFIMLLALYTVEPPSLIQVIKKTWSYYNGVVEISTLVLLPRTSVRSTEWHTRLAVRGLEPINEFVLWRRQ